MLLRSLGPSLRRLLPAFDLSSCQILRHSALFVHLLRLPNRSSDSSRFSGFHPPPLSSESSGDLTPFRRSSSGSADITPCQSDISSCLIPADYRRLLLLELRELLLRCNHQDHRCQRQLAPTPRDFKRTPGTCLAVAWAHPKFGSVLASCSYDGRVIIWKEGTKPEEWIQSHVFIEHKSSVNSIAWAPNELGLCLACGSSDGNISVFTARADGGWHTTKIDQAHPVGVTSVSWAPALAPGALVGSGSLDPVQKLASGGCDNTVKVWKLYNGNWKMDCFPALQMHSDWVRDVSWAPNLGLPKSTIASCSQDGTAVIWTVGKEGDQWEGKVVHDFKTPVWRVTWSLTGNMLAVADGNNSVTLWKEAVDGEWQQVTAVEP
ncbi:putative cytosolic iron-sulfur protein assembly protein CIAO1 like [Apostasia shenzhenica]|uniref:Putative cytosolic iron-sulfur protein assembly protein CIAO1 like n=1 Tax=Apostasia shenzhenica TaxID=1088818 RepID=A0A2I0AQM8_9ASPA|nr:putative cytosolic iron-sulfur protein assembly protein CIAO1 like [Apostasia shenzhenica]